MQDTIMISARCCKLYLVLGTVLLVTLGSPRPATAQRWMAGLHEFDPDPNTPVMTGPGLAVASDTLLTEGILGSAYGGSQGGRSDQSWEARMSGTVRREYMNMGNAPAIAVRL
jgi:hypothetical protein